MATDIAQRPQDMNGLQIRNLGRPQNSGDATFTDNTFVPLPAAGAGAVGSSLLAAPADHVHPATPGTGGPSFIRFTDPKLQSLAAGDTPEVLFDDVVDFDLLPGTRFQVTFSAEMQRVAQTDGGNLQLRVDGDPVDGTSGSNLVSIGSQDDVFTRRAGSTEPAAKPTGRHRVMLTGVGSFRVREKEIVFVGVP